MPPKLTIKAQSTKSAKAGLDEEIQAVKNSPSVADFVAWVAKAKMAINQKYMEIGGDTGPPVADIELSAGEGFRRRYENGTIFVLPPAAPYWVQGSILQKYLALGAEGGFLGYPVTDELTTPGGAGRYNHFERGSIYWTYATGACEIHGAIRDKWASLGWEQGSLGFPKTDEKEFSQGGRVSVFEHGGVYWWPDTGPVALNNVALRYKGLYCFGETNEISAADEPYVVFGVGAVPQAILASSLPTELKTQIYDDVDAGDSRPDTMDIYRGVPGGVVLAVALCEHDEGDPDKYLAQVKQGVDALGKVVGAGCGALLGPEAAPVCEKLWGAASSEIAQFVNDLAGTEDDMLDKWVWEINAKQMITQVGQVRKNWWGIEYHLESKLFSDGESSYKVYLDVVPL